MVVFHALGGRRRLHRRLARHVDQERIREAIARAESATTGSIVVAIAPHSWTDIEAVAATAFERYRLHHTKERNTVFFFVMPSQRRFVILGDAGIHAHVGQQYWETLARELGARIRSSDLTTALVSAIDDVGKQLARAFPP